MSMLVTLLVVFVLVLFSAICSGLNVALMSLDIADLRRKAKLGNPAAKLVLPVRKNIHLSLAGILLVNVAAVSVTSIVLEGQFNGVIAVLISTLLIVIFGEIMPQAIFMRFALGFSATLVPLLRLMILATYPISKPLQLLLDSFFGPQKAKLQSRHELGMIIAEHLRDQESELDADEAEIMRGAITLSEKKVRDIMTPLEQVYWLTPDTDITLDVIGELKATGHSRVPIFNGAKTVCFGVFLVKDLVDINFETAQLKVYDLPLYPCQVVGAMTALDTLFRKFIKGNTHLIPVERNDKIVGIVTIEDVLEEIVGQEIEDETDARKKRRMNVPLPTRKKQKRT
ncbi:MAG TPA: CNNM domain-containing protein [Candidatus Saccharimonadales bacterium]|nr:CNNM domain-containing protein [Candidatus Saccharimonadales bacterium]